MLVESVLTGAANHIPPLLALDRQRQRLPPPCGHRLSCAAAPEPSRPALGGDIGTYPAARRRPLANWPKAKVIEPPNLIGLASEYS